MTYDRVFPYAEPVILFDAAYRDVFGEDNQAMLHAAVDRVQATMDALFADRSGLRLIHNDLHQWNTKIYRGRLYALDFEDMAWSYPLHDVAVTFYYIHGEAQYAALREAYQQGYTRHLPWMEQEAGQIECLMMARALMMLNAFAQSDQAREMADLPMFMRQVQGFMQQLNAMGATKDS
jgi:Ser/Thr protein kinase RdoA (MazF antagonist)